VETEKLAAQLRVDIIEMTHRAGTAHLASALSCADIVSVLFGSTLNLDTSNLNEVNRDRFILSKGHAATTLYAALVHKKILSRQQLETYGTRGSLLEEHPAPKLNGVEAATGSLGHGLPIGNGMALGSKIRNEKFSVFVLMSDGECNEGSVWEAALFAASQKLHNLTAIVDYNKWQATGRSEEVLQLKPLADKWRSFGWQVEEIDGHNHREIAGALNSPSSDKPKILIAHTVKGKGVSFMEDDNNWHYRTPTASEVEKARKEIEA
jgi:transketolase